MTVAGEAAVRGLARLKDEVATLRAPTAARVAALPSGIAIALATLVTVAIYLWRGGDSTLHPQFVAEDGAVFFTEAKLVGTSSILWPYAGYLHLLPRVVALALTVLPSPDAPAAYLAATTLLVAWSSATIASCGQRHAPLLAPLTMLVPVGGEVFATLTNVQWLLQPALLLVAATATPEGPLARWNQRVFALAACLTGPFSIFVAPIAAGRMIALRRDPHALVIGGIVVAGAAVQLAYAVGETSPYEGLRDPLHLAVTMLDQWIGESAHAGRTLRPVQYRDIAVFVPLLAIAVAAVGRLAAWLLLYAGLALAATFIRFLPDSYYFELFWSGARYFYMPRLVLLWIMALCLFRLRRTSFAGLAGVAMMLSAQSAWQKEPLPPHPWAGPAAAIDRGEAVRIIIDPSPVGETRSDAWSVTLPARRP